MDPDVAAAHGTYAWDDVAPHKEAHQYCTTKSPEGMTKPEGTKASSVPEKYTGQGDTFTGEMVKKYAMQSKVDGKDQYFFDFGGARQASKEVLQEYVHVDADTAE